MRSLTVAAALPLPGRARAAHAAATPAARTAAGLLNELHQMAMGRFLGPDA